jgi:hypothetical protein
MISKEQEILCAESLIFLCSPLFYEDYCTCRGNKKKILIKVSSFFSTSQLLLTTPPHPEIGSSKDCDLYFQSMGIGPILARKQNKRVVWIFMRTASPCGSSVLLTSVLTFVAWDAAYSFY